ncbi:hypothetical protein LINPERPRIM_LOCUS3774, partial [Linum perenne]
LWPNNLEVTKQKKLLLTLPNFDPLSKWSLLVTDIHYSVHPLMWTRQLIRHLIYLCHVRLNPPPKIILPKPINPTQLLTQTGPFFFLLLPPPWNLPVILPPPWNLLISLPPPWILPIRSGKKNWEAQSQSSVISNLS